MGGLVTATNSVSAVRAMSGPSEYGAEHPCRGPGAKRGAGHDPASVLRHEMRRAQKPRDDDGGAADLCAGRAAEIGEGSVGNGTRIDAVHCSRSSGCEEKFACCRTVFDRQALRWDCRLRLDGSALHTADRGNDLHGATVLDSPSGRPGVV